MSSRDAFFFLAGALAASALLPVARTLVRGGSVDPSRFSPRRFTYGVVTSITVLVAALSLYASWGSPDSVGRNAAAAAATMAPHPVTGEGASGAPGTMEEATSRLAARLAQSGGTAQEWELLAKSYDFLGRADEARKARARAAAPVSQAPPAREPDAAAMRDLAAAQRLRRTHDDAGACRIYARLAQRGMLSADTWADYADAAAARQGGSLQGEPARYIDAALSLDPRQPKALWLRASLAHEQHREGEALALWRRLAAVLPADSPDQRIIAANIDESMRLSAASPEAAGPTADRSSGGGGLLAVSSPAAGAGAARIFGTVEIAAGLARQVPADATLFIYAKSPATGGPPLAVLRLHPAHWPVDFALDDGNSMIPGRTLSGAAGVEIEARISRSGDALPHPGDLVGSLANVDPHAGRSVRIAIDHSIG